MNPERDYYSYLGVLPYAEEIVIRAAYRALAQRYHPDRFQDGDAEAMRRMQEINEAYEILSDAIKRKEYDAARGKRASRNEYEPDGEDVQSAFADAQRELDNSWQVATEYFPDLDTIVSRLRKVSYKLAFAFQTTLLVTRRFEDCEALATELESEFLRSYFGTNRKIITFARKLIDAGERVAARELNKAVSVLGSDIDADRIISRIVARHAGPQTVKSYEFRVETVRLANEVIRLQEFDLAATLLQRLGGDVRREALTRGVFAVPIATVLTVRLGPIEKSFQNEFTLTQWMKEEIAPAVIKGEGRMGTESPEGQST